MRKVRKNKTMKISVTTRGFAVLDTSNHSTYQPMKKAAVIGKAPKRRRDQGLRRTRQTVATSIARMYVKRKTSWLEWSCEGAGQGVSGEYLAVLRPGHVRVPRGDQNHRRKSYAGREQMVELEGRP
jgi:hypothetical protein